MERKSINDLKDCKQWVCWCYENSNGRICKVPKNPHFIGNAKSNDRTTWGTYSEAYEAIQQYGYDGIGIMFSDNIIGIDIDAVGHGSEEEKENPIAAEILKMFGDTYAEKSPSKMGYHILGLCDISKLPTYHGNGTLKLDSEYYLKNADLGLEVYPPKLTSRFFTFTEDTVGVEYLSDITDTVNDFLEKYMKRKSEAEIIIQKARAAVDGNKFIALFDNGDISKYGNDESNADLALCSMLAFYAKGNENLIDTLFRKSALYRDKWDRDDYRKATIKRALQNNNFKADKSYQKEKEQLYLCSFEKWLSDNDISIRYNEVTHELEIDGLGKEFNQETILEDMDIILFDTLKSVFKCSKQLIDDLLRVIAKKNTYNPVRELLKNAPSWDGIDRLPELFDIMKIDESDELSKTLIHKWLLMALALSENRFNGAFGADGILVIQGTQGIGKTSLVSKLGVEPSITKLGLYIDTKDKDTIIRATSSWICEIGELETTLKSDIERLKAFITADYDRYRVPYGRADSTHTRHTAFIATCNSDRFLIDETGSRRFWTIPCNEKFDLDKLSEFNSIQLWKQMEKELNQYHYSTAYGSPYQLLFRLTSEEQKELSERNAVHEKYLKGQKEIEDILLEAKEHPEKYTYVWVTASGFKDYFDSLKGYTAEQVGKALNRFDVEKKDMRLGDSRTVSKGCRYLPIPKNKTNINDLLPF